MSDVHGSISGFQRLIRLLQNSRKSIIGAFFLVAHPLLLNAISIPATAYIISSLGPLGYGQWAVALSLIASTGVLTNLGVRSAFVRSVARDPGSAPAAFSEQLGLRILLALFAGVVSLVAGVLLQYPATILTCTLVLAIGALFGAVATVVADVLTAIGRLAAMAFINTIAGLALTVASVIAIWFGAGPVGLAFSYLLGPIVTAILSLLLIQRQLFPVRISGNLGRMWTLLKDSRILGLQLFMGSLDTQMANLLLPKLVGISSYGYFAAGTLLPNRLQVVPDGLNTAFYPVLSRSHADGPQSFRSSVKRFFALTVVAGFAAAVPVFFLAGPISRLLFPKQPEICASIIRITVWTIPLICLGSAAGYTLNAAYREAAETKVASVGTITALVLTLLLVVKFGLMGACVALVAKAALNFVVRLPILAATLRTPEVPAAFATPVAGSATPDRAHGI